MGKSDEPLKKLTMALGNSIKSLFKLAPAAAVVFAGVSITFISLIAEHSNLYELFSIILVLIVSIAIYVRAKNFGEAALSLVAGLLAIFSVKWERGPFIIFASTWAAFAVLVLIISSVRLAANVESVRRRAAIRIDPDRYKEVESRLEKSASNTALQSLSPIERANVQLVFAYTNVDLEVFDQAVIFAEQVHVITDVEVRLTARFVADLLSLVQPGVVVSNFLDAIYSIISSAPYPPEEIFEVVRRTKHIVSQHLLPTNEYIVRLSGCLSRGLPPEEIKDAILER